VLFRSPYTRLELVATYNARAGLTPHDTKQANILDRHGRNRPYKQTVGFVSVPYEHPI